MPLSELLLQHISDDHSAQRKSLPQLLNAIRHHLQMDVAFISQFMNDQRVFRHVDPVDPDLPVQPGAADPLENSYCQRVVDGRIPELLRDAKLDPVAAALPVTFALPVGAHLSVPIKLSDGSIYGTFCCFSYTPDQTLDQRDLNMMRVFADVAARLIDSERIKSDHHKEVEGRVLAMLESDCLSVVYQPIYDLERERIAGFEALSRFSVEPYRTPDHWFNDAKQVGLGSELETRAIHRALEALAHLPENVYVSVNISPEHILEGTLDRIFGDMPLDRVLLEITEHAVVELYDDLSRVIQPFRERGMLVAVDDAGAGYASFRHILNLAPDRIKLDMSLTRNIDSDSSRRALAAAFARFSQETGAVIIAEGVETESEINTLLKLGVSKVQGFYIGRPMNMDQAKRMCEKHQDIAPVGIPIPKHGPRWQPTIE